MYKLRDLNTMGYEEITQYMDSIPFFIKEDYGRSGSAYVIKTKSLYPEELDMPTENTARAITVDKFGISCRRISIMNGLIYAREELDEIDNLTKLKEYLAVTIKTINKFNEMYKKAMQERKLTKMKEDFK